MFTGVPDHQATPNLEFRQDLVASFHREAMHERLRDGLSNRPGSAESDRLKLTTQGLDLVETGQRCRRVGGYLGEFCLSGAQQLGLGAEFAYTFGEDVGGEGAGLEGVHVSLDGGLGLGQLSVGCRQLVVAVAHG